MRHLFTLVILSLFFIAATNAQVPQALTYQSIVRDGTGHLVENQPIGVQISIMKNDPNGITVFQERHFPSTNSNGLVTLAVNNGTIVSGIFEDIDWKTGVYYIRVEIDLHGGSAYTQESVSQLLTIPYAFYADKAGSVEGLPDFTNWDKDVTDDFSGKYSDLTGVPEYGVSVDSLRQEIQDLKDQIDALIEFDLKIKTAILSITR